MDGKLITILLLTASLPLIFLVFSALAPNENLSPTHVDLETCETLEFNNEEATNLVFFSPKDEAIKYKNFFQETSPFDENKESFNFYYIDSFKPKCDLYKGIAILCHNRDTIKVGTSCPNDFLIVLKEQPSKIRSSSYENVLSINTNHPLTVLTHEFGHSFANLAEEYTPARLPSGVENCVQSCDDFSYETDGCFEGCSQGNYQRSINNGVMKTLSSNEYGILNEALILEEIKEIPFSPTIGKAISNNNCEDQKYYLIEGSYNKNSITLIDKTLEVGCLGKNGAGNFKYELKISSGEVLTQNDFNPELIFTAAPGEQQILGEVFQSDIPFFLKIPIINQAEILTISEDNNQLVEIRINDIGARACKL